MVRGAEARSADGMLGRAAGCHPERRASLSQAAYPGAWTLRTPPVPLARAGEQQPLLRGWEALLPSGEKAPGHWQRCPTGCPLIPCWSGCGADRQTDRDVWLQAVAYWLKATGNGNIFAVIKVGPCGRGGAQGHRSWGCAGPSSSG